jgi:hypothetical protein
LNPTWDFSTSHPSRRTMSASPDAVLFNNDKGTGQLAGGLLSACAAVPILVTLVFMTLGCMEIGKVKFKDESKNKKTGAKAWAKANLPKWIPLKWFASKPVTAHYISCVFGLLSCVIDAYKKLDSFNDFQVQTCDALCKAFICFYVLSKTCTYVFLGMRARLVFRGEEDARRKVVKWIINILPVGFFVIGMIGTAHAVGSIERGVRCLITIDQRWITNLFPGVDFLFSTIFFILFIVPLKEVASTSVDEAIAQSSKSLNSISAASSTSLGRLLKETTRLAILQIFVSTVSLVFIAVGAIEGGPLGLFTGSFTSFDLVLNSGIQFYSTRRVWTIGDELSAEEVQLKKTENKCCSFWCRGINKSQKLTNSGDDESANHIEFAELDPNRKPFPEKQEYLL